MLIPARHRELTADLRQVLRVEQGLGAILPRPTPTRTFADALAEVPIARRLAARDHPVLWQLRSVTSVVGRLHVVHMKLERLGPEADRSAVEDLWWEFGVAAGALGSLPPQAMRTPTALRSAIAEAVTTCLAVQREEADEVLGALGLARGSVPAVEITREALDDFTGVDLRAVDLDGVRLHGIRWSRATKWPAGWADRVEADSVEIEPGLFEIRPGPSRRASYLA